MNEQFELRIPFSWTERKPVLLYKCLYLPSYYTGEEHLGSLDWGSKDFFDEERPLVVEYCSGNGQWITESALCHPEWNWIAVEMDFERARKTWKKMLRNKLGNLFVVCGEALEFTRRYLAQTSVTAAWVNFPDPWPKKRHAKHRLIQAPFVEEMERVLKRGSTITMVTDDAPYSAQIIEEFASWQSSFALARYALELPGYGTSYFHDLWTKKQLQIRFHRFFYEPKSSDHQ
jgi:tRNA (guanine-N7-)-methyltransferase